MTAAPRGCSRLSGRDRLTLTSRILGGHIKPFFEVRAQRCSFAQECGHLSICTCTSCRMFRKKRRKKCCFIASAVTIVAEHFEIGVFSELICCAMKGGKKACCSKAALKSVALHGEILCLLAAMWIFLHSSFVIFCSHQSQRVAVVVSQWAESLSCPTFYREEHVPVRGGRERRSRLGQQVASCL